VKYRTHPLAHKVDATVTVLFRSRRQHEVGEYKVFSELAN